MGDPTETQKSLLRPPLNPKTDGSEPRFDAETVNYAPRDVGVAKGRDTRGKSPKMGPHFGTP